MGKTLTKTMTWTMLALGVLASLLGAGEAHALLIDRGGGLIYDNVLNITWLQNANLAGTNFTWPNAVSWADTLVFGGFDDWRLPYISRAAAAGPFTGPAVDCSTATELACRDNEYGYMYYQDLTPVGDPGGPPTQFGTNLTGNQGPFTNIQPVSWAEYRAVSWSGTEFDPGRAWRFDFDVSYQGMGLKGSVNSAWAVRPGDTVPEPGSLALVGTGLVGLAGLRWLRRHRK